MKKVIVKTAVAAKRKVGKLMISLTNMSLEKKKQDKQNVSIKKICI